MKNPDFNKIFSSFSNLRAIVIGDVMLDSYLWGKVDRISPEAPVPIVAVTHKESRPGGAANVALNIKALGALPVICSVIGNDRNGKEFIRLLEDIDIPSEGIILSNARNTTVKSRIIGNNHQMLRVDEEKIEDLSADDNSRLTAKIKNLIKKYKADVIVFEDYDKGVISAGLIKEVAQTCCRASIPVTADPKRRNFLNYRGISLFKPNLKELRDGLKIDLDEPDLKELNNVAGRLRESQAIGTLLITLSEHGIYVNNGKEKKLIPAHVRNIADVSGAGDTVISVASLCLALNLNPALIAGISNVAGGQVCEKVGVVPVDKQQLLEELMH